MEGRGGPLLGIEAEQAAPCPTRGDAARAVEALETATPGEDQHLWAFWYPTWDAWKFQRTLTYWISVMYLEGSILFTIGAAFSMTALAEHARLERALVAVPYFAGGICFTIGSYLGVLEVVNAPNKGDSIKQLFLPLTRGQWRRLLQFVSWRAVAGYSSYTAGALCFNVNTVAGFTELSPMQEKLLVWLAAVFGSLGFLFGSVLECITNRVWDFNVLTGSWWLSVSNLLGSCGFLVAGVSGFFGTQNAKWLEDFPYLFGSMGFMVGAECTLWMWKCEQYGLGFMPELNVGARTVEPSPEAVMSLHEEYGCGRATVWQMPFLTVYLTSASASVCLCGLALLPKRQAGVDWEYQVMESLLNVALSHGVMLLGSVVHHIPTARPHNWLLIYMRIVLLFYFVNNCLTLRRRIETELQFTD